MSTPTLDDHEFWMRVRRGHLTVVRAIESKLGIQGGPTMKLVRVVNPNYHRPVDTIMQVDDSEADRLVARGIVVVLGTVHIEVDSAEALDEIIAEMASTNGAEESHQDEPGHSDDDDEHADDGEE